VIAAASYEIIRFSGRHAGSALVKATAAPGILLQGLTTRKPDDGQIEVAIAAMKLAIEADQKTAVSGAAPAAAATRPQV
jgi:uncharacterized protein YqhQ